LTENLISVTGFIFVLALVHYAPESNSLD